MKQEICRRTGVHDELGFRGRVVVQAGVHHMCAVEVLHQHEHVLFPQCAKHLRAVVAVAGRQLDHLLHRARALAVARHASLIMAMQGQDRW